MAITDLPQEIQDQLLAKTKSKWPECIRDRCDDQYSYVPEGWHSLVEQLHNDIIKFDPDYTIAQMKTKFGGLRYYINCSSSLSDENKNFIREIIDEAESKSFKTCTVCGAPAIARTTERGWRITSCEKHIDEACG